MKEKETFANKNNEEGFINKKKKAFTLIELLAIIVILAIIAVITVPIILNIIENSKKGAATDSAYGYKDAVNKYYVTELSDNNNLNLEGEYTVSDGSLIGKFEGSTSEQKTVSIPVSGDKPSAGELHYSNNVLQGGCIVIGDYEVVFTGSSVSSTTKGDCDNYVYNEGNMYKYTYWDTVNEKEESINATEPNSLWNFYVQENSSIKEVCAKFDDKTICFNSTSYDWNCQNNSCTINQTGDKTLNLKSIFESTERYVYLSTSLLGVGISDSNIWCNAKQDGDVFCGNTDVSAYCGIRLSENGKVFCDWEG